MIKLGLTGSIATGKTTVANIFKKFGIAVYNADEEIKKLYQRKDILQKLQEAFPKLQGKIITKECISKYLLQCPQALAKLEEILHPFVAESQQQFINLQKKNGKKLVLLEIVLLFEKNKQKEMDKILVTIVDEEIQKKRALERENMTKEKLELLLKRQMPSAKKCEQADYIINTGKDLQDIEKEVQQIINSLL